LLSFRAESFVFRLAFKNIKIKISKTVFFPFGFYGCEAWFLVMREDHTLRVLENRVPRKIFESKGYGVREEWIVLHKEELHDLYSSLNVAGVVISTIMRWAGHVAQDRRIEGFDGKT